MASLRVETRYAASWPGFDQGVQNVNDARDISLPSDVSHRDVGVNPDVFFASDKSGQWYAQKKQSWVAAAGGGWYSVQLSINRTPAKGCVRLQAGDVLELKAYRPGVLSAAYRWRAVLLEEQSPSAIVESSEETSLFDVLGGHDVLSVIITQLGGHSWYPGHSTSTYALAATCRAGRAAVDRWLAPLIPQLVKRSLWLLVGEKWPLTVLHAKVDAKPDECKAELVEMLSPGSLRGTGNFPFETCIQKPHAWGKEPVPAGTLLEKASPDALASLCARIPAGAACLEAFGDTGSGGGSGEGSSSSRVRPNYYDHVHKVQQALLRRLTAPIQRATRRLRVT